MLVGDVMLSCWLKTWITAANKRKIIWWMSLIWPFIYQKPRWFCFTSKNVYDALHKWRTRPNGWVVKLRRIFTKDGKRDKQNWRYANIARTVVCGLLQGMFVKRRKMYNRNVHEPYERAMLKCFIQNFLLLDTENKWGHNCKIGEETLNGSRGRRHYACIEVKSKF